MGCPPRCEEEFFFFFFLGKGIIYRLVQQKNGPEAKSVLKIPAAPMRAHEELSMPPIHHV